MHRKCIEDAPIGTLKLHSITRRGLEDMLAHAESPRQRRRAQALLWVDAGEQITQIARRLGVSRQSIYNWIGWLDQRKRSAVGPLDNGGPYGRLLTKSKVLDEVVPQLLCTHPRKGGCSAAGWTNHLLRDYLLRVHCLKVSAKTLTFAVQRAGYTWERTRYVLCKDPCGD